MRLRVVVVVGSLFLVLYLPLLSSSSFCFGGRSFLPFGWLLVAPPGKCHPVAPHPRLSFSPQILAMLSIIYLLLLENVSHQRRSHTCHNENQDRRRGSTQQGPLSERAQPVQSPHPPQRPTSSRSALAQGPPQTSHLLTWTPPPAPCAPRPRSRSRPRPAPCPCVCVCGGGGGGVAHE